MIQKAVEFMIAKSKRAKGNIQAMLNTLRSPLARFVDFR